MVYAKQRFVPIPARNENTRIKISNTFLRSRSVNNFNNFRIRGTIDIHPYSQRLDPPRNGDRQSFSRRCSRRDPLTLWNLCSQVRYHNVMRRILSVSRHRDRPAFLDRVHEFGAEPVDLRVLQPRLPRSFQEYSAVRVLLALQTRAVRSRGARFPSAVPKVRSGLTRWGTHYILSLFLLPFFLFFVHPDPSIELDLFLASYSYNNVVHDLLTSGCGNEWSYSRNLG